MKPLCTTLTLCAVLTACAQPETSINKENPANRPRVLMIGNLSWEDVDALDRDKTLFILTVGMLEEHGPHLPIAADTIGVEYEVGKVADGLASTLQDWNVVVMPTLHYGSAGANQFGNRTTHPGTYNIRQSTLRSVVADIGGQISQNRFKWIFVITGHGAPAHHTALNDACDFVSQEFKTTMLNITGLFSADPQIQAEGDQLRARHFPPPQRSSVGFDAHAGVSETSGMLFLHPEMVRSSYLTLPDLPVQNFIEAREVAMRTGWAGYLSSPRMATEAYGRDVEAWWVEGMTDLILRAVRGENLFMNPRRPDNLPDDPVFRQFIERQLESELESEGKLERWLAERRKR